MTASDAPALVWLRQDLRLADNPALDAAHKSGRPLHIVYVLDDKTPGDFKIGGASRWWLHESLAALARDITKRGAALTLRRGDAAKIIPALIAETGAGAIYWNRCYEPYAVKRDTKLKDALTKKGVEVHSCNASLLYEPWTIRTGAGEPFKVFTPYWRACLKSGAARTPTRAPKKLRAAPALESDDLQSWALQPSKPNWASGLGNVWTPGEAGAAKALDTFLEHALADYVDDRNRPDREGTSRLSPHLHYGEISPVQVWSALEAFVDAHPAQRGAADKLLAELGWREFSHHLLYNWPDIPTTNWRDTFDPFPWRDDDKGFAAWCAGATGYPLVDAGMRQLWTTGWMHNRVRMVTASFLIKHLMVDWRKGAAWFWDTLVDADLANNSASWQWVAGSGADASPFFRIFNPIEQAKRFDPDGDYIRHWVPELAALNPPEVHEPWLTEVKGYPAPIVEHKAARERALDAYKALR